MSRAEDRKRFLAEPTRLAIAELCRDEALTLREIAGELRRDPGSLSQPKTMLGRGALIAGAPRPAADGRGGGRTFRFNDEWEEALEEARRGVAPQWPANRQDLLLVPFAEAEAACAVLAAEMPADVEWGARLYGGISGLVLAPAASEGERGALRVADALSTVAPRLQELHLTNIMPPAELRAWCSGGGRSARELHTGP